MSTNASPEIAKRIQIGECTLNYHDQGEGEVILLIHGSGPGVTAWANWRGVIPTLSQRARIIAPDMLGFGYTSCPPEWKLDPATWVESLVGLLSALDIFPGCPSSVTPSAAPSPCISPRPIRSACSAWC